MVIVTSNYHTRRARYIFRRCFPAGIAVSVASARDGDFDPERWWEKRKSVKLFMRELAGMVEAMWELRDVKQKRRNGRDGRMSTAASGTVVYKFGHNCCGKILALPFTCT